MEIPADAHCMSCSEEPNAYLHAPENCPLLKCFPWLPAIVRRISAALEVAPIVIPTHGGGTTFPGGDGNTLWQWTWFPEIDASGGVHKLNHTLKIERMADQVAWQISACSHVSWKPLSVQAVLRVPPTNLQVNSLLVIARFMDL